MNGYKHSTNKNSIAMFLCVMLIGTIALLTGCSLRNTEPISDTGIYFDTVITISIYDSKDTKLLSHCFSMCHEFEEKFSRTIDTSEISKINAAKGEPVTVSDDTIELIQQGLYYSQISDGAFDITIAPLSNLWDFKNNTKNVPSKQSIQTALSHMGYRKVKVNGNQVTLEDSSAAIDLGGIAKGYIADRLKKYLESRGIKSALINLGGNVLAVGQKPDGSEFNIGIQKPFDQQNASITSVEIDDKSVVSSGVYERYFKKNGVLYHHLLDTTTGYPTKNNLLGVTIISKKSVDGDGLSTTCFVLGLEKGTKLIRSMNDVEAIFITDDYKLHHIKD